MRRTPVNLQSAACQLAYWDAGRLRIVNYLTRRKFAANPITLDLIRFFFTARTIPAALVEFRAYSRKSVTTAILRLIASQLLLEPGSNTWHRDKLLESCWKPWLPEGGFHFMTKDAPYIGADWSVEERLQLLPATAAPAQFKPVPRNRALPLPAPETDTDAFFATLHARKTHREFAREPVSLESVAKLLHMTWGVQGYVHSNVFGPLPHKTSPSGGARHPGEVYLLALNVAGLARGLYYYAPRDHCLTKLSSKASRPLARVYCADQAHFAGAGALFIMTAVFARTMWKYGQARAYRVVLLEAGHLAQTFCLTATRMGLAPFTTAAVKDTLIEKDLGIDGIAESVLYVTGVGVPAHLPP